MKLLEKNMAARTQRGMKAANVHCWSSKNKSRTSIVVDEREAIREFNKLISENKTPPAELPS